jgi:hypothetical protein
VVIQKNWNGRQRWEDPSPTPAQRIIREILFQKQTGCDDIDCGLNYSGGRGRRNKVQGWPKEKHETLSEKPN